MLRRWCRELKIRDDIIDHIHDAIIVTDINSIIVTWNHGAGLKVIAKGCRMMKEKGGNILVISMQPQIQRVFDTVKELPNLRMFKNQEEMDDYLDALQELVKSKS